MSAVSTISNGAIVSGTDKNSKTPTQQSKNRSHGIPRILLGIVTLGISELVLAIHSYYTRKAQAQPPQAMRTPLNGVRRQNYKIICSSLESKTSPFPEAIQNAILDAQDCLKPIITSVDENILKQSLSGLQMRLHEFPEPFTSQSFELELTKEIKFNLVKKLFSKTLIERLQQEGISEPPTECISQMCTVETSTLKQISTMPKEKISEAMNKLILKSTAIILSNDNAKQARKKVLEDLKLDLITQYSISEQEAKEHSKYKELSTKLVKCCTELQDAKQAEHPGEYPVVTVDMYQDAFLKFNQSFLSSLM